MLCDFSIAMKQPTKLLHMTRGYNHNAQNDVTLYCISVEKSA